MIQPALASPFVPGFDTFVTSANCHLRTGMEKCHHETGL
jgi:hypothetical protein